MSPAEREIISADYDISKQTVIPSLFTTSPSTSADLFPREDLVAVASEVDMHHHMIGEEIEKNRMAGKPVVVFFATEGDLMSFLASPRGRLLDHCRVVTERTENIDYFVQHATIVLDGEVPVTLFTRVLGRGASFVAYDPSIETIGGVHVVQTFFSECIAEERQIQGRTTRQGQSGSYNMILLSAQLEAMYRLAAEEVEHAARKKVVYELLCEKRRAAMPALIAAMKWTAEKARAQHESSVEFRRLLKKSGPCGSITRTMMSFAHSNSANLHIIFCVQQHRGSASLVEAILRIRKASSAANKDKDKDLISALTFADTASLVWSQVTVDHAIANRSALERNWKSLNSDLVPVLDLVKQQMISEPSGMGVAVVFITSAGSKYSAVRVRPAVRAAEALRDGFLGSSFQFFGVICNSGSPEETMKIEGVLREMVGAAGEGNVVLGKDVDALRHQFQGIAREVSASFAL